MTLVWVHILDNDWRIPTRRSRQNFLGEAWFYTHWKLSLPYRPIAPNLVVLSVRQMRPQGVHISLRGGFSSWVAVPNICHFLIDRQFVDLENFIEIAIRPQILELFSCPQQTNKQRNKWRVKSYSFLRCWTVWFREYDKGICPTLVLICSSLSWFVSNIPSEHNTGETCIEQVRFLSTAAAWWAGRPAGLPAWRTSHTPGPVVQRISIGHQGGRLLWRRHSFCLTRDALLHVSRKSVQLPRGGGVVWTDDCWDLVAARAGEYRWSAPGRRLAVVRVLAAEREGD